MAREEFRIKKQFGVTLIQKVIELLGQDVGVFLVKKYFPNGEIVLAEGGKLQFRAPESEELFKNLIASFTRVLVVGFGLSFAEAVVNQIYSRIRKEYPDNPRVLSLVNFIPGGTLKEENIKLAAPQTST